MDARRPQARGFWISEGPARTGHTLHQSINSVFADAPLSSHTDKQQERLVSHACSLSNKNFVINTRCIPSPYAHAHSTQINHHLVLLVISADVSVVLGLLQAVNHHHNAPLWLVSRGLWAAPPEVHCSRLAAAGWWPGLPLLRATGRDRHVLLFGGLAGGNIGVLQGRGLQWRPADAHHGQVRMMDTICM